MEIVFCIEFEGNAEENYFLLHFLARGFEHKGGEFCAALKLENV